jgi:uncharacterized membrane protein YjfL (UPF0719 family)
MAGIDIIASSLIMALIQLLVGLVLSMGSVYIGLKMFDKLTKGIDEWKEIQKGNVAVGIVMTAVIISIATVIKIGVLSLTASIDPATGVTMMALGLVVGIVNLAIGVIAAIISIYVAINVLDKITTEIDEMKELKKGNVAVALIIAGVLIAVSFVISAAVEGITSALDVTQVAMALGIRA